MYKLLWEHGVRSLIDLVGEGGDEESGNNVTIINDNSNNNNSNNTNMQVLNIITIFMKA